MQKLALTLLYILCVHKAVTAQTSLFNPSVSLLTSYTTMQHDAVTNDGSFNIDCRKMNLALELNNKMELPGNYFINTGIRISSYQTQIQAKEIVVTYYTWQKTFNSFTIPVSVGRNFTTANGNKGDYYAGMSAGILVEAAEQQSAGTSYTNRTQDSIASSSSSVMQSAPTVFFATADFGVHYQLFNKIPRLQAGLMCSLQLTRSATSAYNANVSEYPGTSHNYGLEMKQRFISYSFMLRYQLGKLRKTAKTIYPELRNEQ